MSNMRFEVNSDSIVSGIINGEIQARICCKARNANNPEAYKKGLQKYIEAGIVDSTPAIVDFMKKHPIVFQNPKLISQRNGNIFEEMITLAPQTTEGDYAEKVRSRMIISHDLLSDELEGMDVFFSDFHALQEDPEVISIIGKTKQYKNSIERLWKSGEKDIISHIEYILGYSPERVGTVSTYVMYPNYDTHRSCQVSGNSTSLFLGKRGDGAENKILAHLAHQAVHQPMIPYKMSMSKKDKEKLHAFIKFLTDKEIFAKLSGESSLGITTPQENHELMGKIYPYWLGYRFRNARKDGLEPVEEIDKVLRKDIEYFSSLPEGSKAKINYSHYDFKSLDPNKIAEFFRYKKGITPYEFIQIDFDNRDNVCRITEREEKTSIREEITR